MRTILLSRLIFTGFALGSQSCAVRSISGTMPIPPIIVPAKKEHKASVIFLHGLGDQGDGWADTFRSELKRNPNVRFICPNSEEIPVTLNGGTRMPAWFDLKSLAPAAPEDDEGIATATKLVHNIIESEIEKGIPSEKIIIGGFSMGGALALYAGLTCPRKLGGIIGLSSFLIQRNKLPGEVVVNKDTPIFMGHGSVDFLVPLQYGQLSESLLRAFNSNITFKVYNGMAHSSCNEELRDLDEFIHSSVKI